MTFFSLVFSGGSPFWLHLFYQLVLVVKNSLANAGDIRDIGLIPGLGRSPGKWHGNLLQYSCLENPMDRGDLWAKVHTVTKGWKRLSMQAQYIAKIGLSYGASGKEPFCQGKRQEMRVQSLGQEDTLEKYMATYSSILA